MLQQVDVFGVQPGSLRTLIMGDTADSVQIKDIKGLEPVKADIVSTRFGNIRGEAFTGSSVGKRNIIFVCGLNPDWATQTMEELRIQLYAFFMPTFPVTLQFTSTHVPLCKISGVVEDFAPNIFSKDPEISVSILCMNPDFVAVDETTVDGVVVDDDEFELISYEGTTDTGIHLYVDNTEPLESYFGPIDVRAAIGPYVPEFWDSLIIDPVHIDSAQSLEVNSVPGSKFVHRVDNGTHNFAGNILAFVFGDPVWPKLRPGDNQFAVKADDPGPAWTLSYFARFGGL